MTDADPSQSLIGWRKIVTDALGTFIGVGMVAFFGLLWTRSTQNINDEYDNDRKDAVNMAEIQALRATVVSEISKIRAEMETTHGEEPKPQLFSVKQSMPKPKAESETEDRKDAYNALEKKEKEVRQTFYDNLNMQQQSLPPPRG